MCFRDIAIKHSVFQMKYINYFKDLIESIVGYRKIVLLMFLIENITNNDLLTECKILKDDIYHLNKEFINILIQQNEEYWEYIKNEEESIIEKLLNK